MDTSLTTTSIPADSVSVLADQISREIDTYRHRQISTFREVAIVQAVATWGVGQLGLAPAAVKPSRFLASVACLAAGLLGSWIIQIYKHRIYYLRERRNELYTSPVGGSPAFSISSLLRLSKAPFYPTDSPPKDPFYARKASSTVYTAALLVVSVATALVNFIAAVVH